MEEVRTINERGQLVYVVTFNGIQFKRYPSGKHPNYYYHKWKSNGVRYHELLHHAVYKFHHGEIPKGCVIHHRDGNPLNNDIENLVAVTPSEHSKIHQNLLRWNKEHPEEHAKRFYSKSNWHQRREKVIIRLANERRICEWCGAEYTPTNTHQRFCSKQCHHRWQYKSADNNVERMCAQCGKPFYTSKYTNTICCSDECAHQLAKAHRPAHNRPRVL